MNLITKVNAQGLDAYVSPTIPFIPPDGPPGPTGTGVTPIPDVPYIILDSTFTNVEPGQRFTIQLKIHTQGIPIQGFKFLINYDPALLTVVDADTDNAGTQINYLNSFFIPEQHIIEETETTGEIFIIANSSEDTTTISDISVAIIEFESQSEGFAEVSIVQEESALLTSNSTDVLEYTNALDFIISEGTSVDPTASPTSIIIDGTIIPSRTPDTALSDVLGAKSSMIIGALLISAGVLIIKNIKNAKISR